MRFGTQAIPLPKLGEDVLVRRAPSAQHPEGLDVVARLATAGGRSWWESPFWSGLVRDSDQWFPLPADGAYWITPSPAQGGIE